jgi:diguanylate cyclase (GGDEF)-like protein
MAFINSLNLKIEDILNDIGDVAFLLNEKMEIVACNQNFANFYKKSAKEIIGISSFVLYPDFEHSVFYEAIKETMKSSIGVTRIGYSTNAKKWIAARATKYSENLYFILAHEIKDALKTGYVSLYDNLTSLHNRFSLEDDLYRFFNNKTEFSILLIDILRFKSINESFGVQVGDMCLMEIAAKIKSVISRNYKTYRFNADQFAVLIPSVDINIIELEVKNILLKFKEKFIIDKNEILLDVALGYTVISDFTQNITDILSNTEFALKEAKKKKNTAIEYVSNKNKKTTKNKIILANELKEALKKTELELYYQPQFDVKTKRICGAESLIRWNHPTRGFISPGDFLPIAEEFDLMIELDRYVMAKAFRDIIILNKKGINLPIAINLSSKSITDIRTVAFYNLLLERAQINTNQITIEITENAFIDDIETSKEVIEGIKKTGTKIAIDDFGTGYSSMSYLLKYPTSYLKIDREFIKEIHKETSQQNIVSNLIKMAHSLGMTVVAEGVEVLAEAILLEKYDCDVIQGYLFGKPQSLNDLIKNMDQYLKKSVKITSPQIS